MIAATLGGIGLFLLGMILLTDGLKAAAGEALRTVLARFAGGPVSAFLSGAAVTALVQSSSATTLATIGFVSAGLLTFSQAVGVIIGANVGTTSTSWIVSTLGLKLNVSTFGLPLVGVGALTRMFTKGRLASIGVAIAGFGLIFVGIDVLQGGMKELAAKLDPAGFPSTGLTGRVVLVTVGILMTVVMQSSSAAVATTLAALHAGALRIEQAAALVVGQNIGTTVTAAIASVGATVPAKRTALAHVVFNAATGVVAFALLPLLVRIVLAVVRSQDPTVAIAAFHTAFNLLGVAIFLPITNRYAAWISTLVKERGPALTRYLDASLHASLPIAIDAARRATRDCAIEIFDVTRAELQGDIDDAATRLDAPDLALDEVRRFLAKVRSPAEVTEGHQRHISTLHAVDHLERMILAARETSHVRLLKTDPEIAATVTELEAAVASALEWARSPDKPAPVPSIAHHARMVSATRRTHRATLLRNAAEGAIEPELAVRVVDSLRWLDRLAYHTWRAVHHLDDRRSHESASETEEVEAELG